MTKFFLSISFTISLNGKSLSILHNQDSNVSKKINNKILWYTLLCTYFLYIIEHLFYPAL
eukprot:UN16677